MYKNKDIRHMKQRTHTGSFSLENKLMDYLRNNYSLDIVQNPSTSNAVLQDLVYRAKRIDLASGKKENLNKNYVDIATDTIFRFIENQGNDNYGNGQGAFAKKHDPNEELSTIKDTINNIKY